MADEFTPTTEQVCETYAALCGTEAAEDEFWRWLAAHDRETKAEALREAADWLLRIGYVADITFDIAAPAALWEAFVDAAHRDADGTMHGNTLTRAEVDDWLSVESGRLAAEGGADRG